MLYWTEAPVEGAFNIPMAIIDFLPVLFFFLAAVRVTKDLYSVTSERTHTLLAGGTVMCFVGGAFKALWKLLFCFGINYPFLYTSLFPMQGPGFCIFMAGLIFALRETKNPNLLKNKDNDNLNVVAASVTSSLPLLFFQTLGSIGSLIVLAIFGFRMKRPVAAVCFIVAIVSLLGMGYMGATIDASLEWANWVEQGINAFGQFLFYVGALILHKSGYVKGEQHD